MPRILATALFCIICFGSLSSAQAATPLEQSMKRMATAYHKLDKDLKTPLETSKPDYLALAGVIKTEIQTSRALIPKKVAAMPQAQQAGQVVDFQKSLDDMSGTVDTLTADLQASNWPDASAQIAKIKVQEDAGHKKFRIPKKEGAAEAPAPPATPAPATP